MRWYCRRRKKRKERIKYTMTCFVDVEEGMWWYLISDQGEWPMSDFFIKW